MLIQNFCVETDQFLGRESIQVAADRIDRTRDVLGRAMGRALKQHMLDEVRNTVLLGHLPPRAGPDPDADRHRAHMRHGFGDHTDTITERGRLDFPRGADGGSGGGQRSAFSSTFVTLSAPKPLSYTGYRH